MIMPIFRVGLLIMLIGLPLLAITWHSAKTIITGKVKIESKMGFITIKTVTYEGKTARRFGAITAVGYTLMLLGFSLSAFPMFREGTYLTFAFCGAGIGFGIFGYEILRRADKQLDNH